MRTVTVKRQKLLDTLRVNREKHIADYTEAREGYVKRAIASMQKNLKAAKNGGEVKTVIDLPVPVSFASNYDVAIAMLEWSEDLTIELDQNEFEQYVRDNWVWKNMFAAGASLYNSKVK